MTLVTYASGMQTASGGEDFLSSPNAVGDFQLILDLSGMQSGDVLEVRAYMMAKAGGTSRAMWFQMFNGVQPAQSLIVMSEWIANTLTDTNAVRFSIKQTFGTGRIYDWRVTQRTDQADVWNFVLENGQTVAWYLRVIIAALIGKVSGVMTDAPKFRDQADTKNRISATTTADGRTSVTLDGS